MIDEEIVNSVVSKLSNSEFDFNESKRIFTFYFFKREFFVFFKEDVDFNAQEVVDSIIREKNISSKIAELKEENAFIKHVLS